MADLGSDFAGTDDITPDLGEVDGRLGLGEALVTRLIQPRGGLFYDPNYGIDVRALLSAEIKPRGIEQSIANQLLADERVEAASVVVTFVEATREFSIVCTVTDADGPFQLVINPADASFSLFESQL